MPWGLNDQIKHSAEKKILLISALLRIRALGPSKDTKKMNTLNSSQGEASGGPMSWE